MMNRSPSAKTVLLSAAILCFSSPASAIDGEILIDQQAVNAGGITPGDTPGFPATLSRRGKYKLSGTLVAPINRSGIQVTADDVTIDLNGFGMFGNSVGRTGRGIDASGVEGLTVMNGTIAKFPGFGAFNRPGAFARIENMRIRENGSSGIDVGEDARIVRNTIVDNGVAGIVCRARCLIEQNVIAGAKTDSGVVLLTDAGGHAVLGNAIVSNKLFGIYSEGTSGYGDNTLSGNNPQGGNNFGPQVIGALTPLHPNACAPGCP